MKKYLLLSLFAIFSVGMSFAQVSLTEPDPSVIGNDSAEQALKNILVDNFEREGSWTVRMSLDAGVVTGRLFSGGPAGKEDEKELVEGEKDVGENNHSFGVKAEFFRRGINSIYIEAVRPIPIEGVTKTVSVWVAGRNMDHSLFLLVQDFFGRNYELYMGSLAFTSWKKITVAVPPSVDGVHGIVQSSAYYGNRPGLRITGFRIDCDPVNARGAYYVYFDGMHAVTDLYDIENHDVDDMDDNW
ncbi:flagellar filament protein FlaA [Treponema parvum]|uniref:Flagellar filament protein FlaA n=1 Tax=Treponema parvum TaxID=138851 RepID=A0A975F0B7_9SPIR|nr:flagellar filament outer layer protein FlaA [Treponema parvum]QTQ12077.1 flagellar filament protein FlaA [Treponema parvum]QTQ15947.1 flagellar filament protein FlaA [Treponema parvum]